MYGGRLIRVPGSYHFMHFSVEFMAFWHNTFWGYIDEAFLSLES